MKLTILITCIFICGHLSAQNAGIGTNVPTGKLHVAANSTLNTPQIKIEETDANDYARFRFANGVNLARYWDLAGYIGTTVSLDRLNIYNSGVGDMMTFSGNGNVGIAQPSPNFRLDVNGSFNFNGVLALGNNTGLAGQMPRSTGGGQTAWAYPTTLIADSSKLRYCSSYFDLMPGMNDVNAPGWSQRITLPSNGRIEIDFNLIVQGLSCIGCGDSYFAYFVKINRTSDNAFVGGGNGYGRVANGRNQSFSNVFVSNAIVPPGEYLIDLYLTHISGPIVHVIAEIGSNFFIKAWYQ